MSHRNFAHNAYAGPVTCLRCDKTFRSWDRRHNRLCPVCHDTIRELPAAEDSYPTPNRLHPGLLRGE